MMPGQLGVGLKTISKCLKDIDMILNVVTWIPHELTARTFVKCYSPGLKGSLYVMGDEKWMYFSNIKRKPLSQKQLPNQIASVARQCCVFSGIRVV